MAKTFMALTIKSNDIIKGNNLICLLKLSAHAQQFLKKWFLRYSLNCLQNI